VEVETETRWEKASRLTTQALRDALEKKLGTQLSRTELNKYCRRALCDYEYLGDREMLNDCCKKVGLKPTDGNVSFLLNCAIQY
jgi:hypothetical protein